MKVGNLLIVDDEPLILKKMSNRLKKYAENVWTALNGLEALKELKNNQIHCIICDINMPKMNGVELIRRVRSEGNNVPFIFFTAHGSHELMMEAAKYGTFDFLNKPNLDGLEDIIQRGLKEGFERQHQTASNSESYVSEFMQLLQKLDKK